VRAFHVAGAAGEISEVEFGAKVLGTGGRIVASKVFAGKVPAASAGAQGGVAALDAAFGKAAVELAVWVHGVLQGRVR